jgi:type IV secretion system protein VirD4
MFMLDELATLGRLDQVENAIGLARGYGIQMWSIFQDVGQIKGTYGAKWSSFVGNAGLRMFFGTQDYETGQLVSDMIGDETVQIHQIDGTGVVVDRRQHGRRLVMPDEVMRMRQDSMVAFIPGERPVMVRRVPYYGNQKYKDRWDDPRM